MRGVVQARALRNRIGQGMNWVLIVTFRVELATWCFLAVAHFV